MRATRFILLTRPHCHLCEIFDTELSTHFGEQVETEHVHVDAHPQWLALYGNSIPVLLSESGSFICAVDVDVAAVRAHLT